MQLQDIMSRDVQTIAAAATLQEAAKEMAARDLGFLLVGASDQAAGVLTDRDIVIRCVAQGDDPRQTPVEKAMTREVEIMEEHTSIEQAAERMRKEKIRRLLVEDTEHKIVGVVALGDLAVEVPGTHLAGRTLEEVSRPSS